MDEASDDERATILKLVEDGHYPPRYAETWAKKFGCEPFASGPNPTAPSPAKISQWTLSMAAAWFIWRSYVAVLHQTPEARVGWKIWEPITPPSGGEKLKRSFVDSLVGNLKYRLVNIHPARFWRVFYEARWDPLYSRLDDLPRNRPAQTAPDPIVDLPFSRFMAALQTGKLIATHTHFKNGEGILETPEYWLDNFNRYEWPRADRRPFIREAAYSVSPQAVIDAESDIARKEFEQPILGLEQALGWVAYQNIDEFRSLGRYDLRGKPYYNQLYDHDYKILKPEEKLFVSIIEGRLKGYRKGAELALHERIEMKSIWDASDVRFFRKDLVDIWPDQFTRARDEGLRIPHIRIGQSVFTSEESGYAQSAIADEDVAHSEPPHAAAQSFREAEGGPARVARSRGPRPAKFESVKVAMIKAIENDPTAAERLQRMTEKEFRRAFGDISRHLARKVRAALSQFVGVNNSDK